MVLGLRYPKAHEMGHIQDSTGNGVNNQLIGTGFGTGSAYTVTNATQWFFVNPGRYSQVRKVSLWASMRLLDATPPTENVRLRLTMSSSDPNTLTPIMVSIAPGAVVKLRGSGSAYPASPTSETVLFAKTGDFEPLQAVATFAERDSTFVLLEFDRFEASSADFFNAWDALVATADDDSYVALIPVLELDGASWASDSKSTNLQLWNFGLSIVQAPAGVNRTTTFVNLNCGWISYGAEDSTFGAARAWPFAYDASQWDGIVSMHVWSMLPNPTSGNGWDMELKLAHMPVSDGSPVTDVPRYLEAFDIAVGSGQGDALHRSLDVFPSIVDGDNLGIEWRKVSGLSVDQPWGYLEIVQEDFSLTVCPHVASISTQVLVTEVGGPEDFAYSKGYFDPQWYQSFTDDLISASMVWGGLKHVSGSTAEFQQVALNADTQADPATSGFNAYVQPLVGTSGSLNFGYKIVRSAITVNDPINLAGPRTLVTRFLIGVWNLGQPGGMLLAYAITVPNREFLPLGPLFDLGAFSPEGCAATSAGLGEPPLLAITNGSVIPKKFNPTAVGTAGEIEDLGIPLPFPEEVPTAQVDDTANSPDGGLDLGFYNYRYTFRNCCTGAESNPSDMLTVDTSGASPAARVTLSFAGLRIPSDPQICEICVYRTVVSLTEEGLSEVILAKVGCFDPDATTLFVDEVDDTALDFLNDGISFLNGPPPCCPIVVDFRNKLFMMGDIPNLTPAGTVSVVNGSDIVTGDGSVEWDRCLEGKFIKVAGDCRSYEISRVMPPVAGTSPAIARLKLVDLYEGTSDTGLTYTICGRPNRLYESEPLSPEYWPEANFIDVEPGDGDRLMGAVSNFDRLIICKRRKTYVLTFRESAALEVIVPSRISSDIGCIGPRTFAQVESGSVWLADRGLALYDGRSVGHVPESEAMNNIFVDPDNPHYVRRDRNGRVIDAVGVFYPKREQYLLLLPTIQTERGCNLMLVWDVKLKNITLLKFCQEFQSMVVGKDADGNERVYLGDVNGFVWIYDIGDTDGVGYPNATGTVTGTVASSGTDDNGADYLTCDAGGFITGGLPGLASLSGIAGLSGAFAGDDLGLAGVCVYTRPADAELDDPWVVRTIYAATDDTLYITPPWGADAPAAGDDFMIGAIDFVCVFKPQNYGVDDTLKRSWRHALVHEIESFGSEVRVELLPDFSQVDPEELTVIDPVTQETGEGRVFRMDYSKGRQVKPVGRSVYDFMAVRMRNFAPEQPVQIINHVLMTTPKSSK